MSWKEWKAWQAMYDHWKKAFGEKNINLKWPYLRGLYDWLMRELEAHPEVDIETLDIPAFLSHEISFEDAKRILKSLMAATPTDREYESMFEDYKGMLEKQVREKYPEILEPLTEKLVKLEEELTKEKAKGKRKFARIKKLEASLGETERRLEEERAKPPEVEPIKIRILRTFREGIIDYTVGSVIETRNLDWAMDKIEKGYAERVAVEVPVEKVLPVEKVEWTRTLERKLRDVFETTLRVGLPEEKIEPVTPYRFLPEFRLELETVKTLPTEDEMRRHVERLAKVIVRREGKPIKPPEIKRPPLLPPGWAKVTGGYLVNGRFISEEEMPAVMKKMNRMRVRLAPPPKPPGLNLKDWLMWEHGLAWGEFLRLSAEERKILLNTYERLSRENI